MSDYGTPPPPPPPPAGGLDPQQGQGYSPPPPPPGGYAAAPAVGYGQPTQGRTLAEWGQRAAGYLVDMLVPGIPGGILVGIGMGMAGSGATADPVTGDLTGGNPAGLAIAGIGYLAMFAFQVWNRWIKGGQGQTIGRKMMGISLVGEETGQPIGTLMAFVRDIAHVLDSIICGLPIGYLWPLWDAKKQTWADKVVKTVVVNVPK